MSCYRATLERFLVALRTRSLRNILTSIGLRIGERCELKITVYKTSLCKSDTRRNSRAISSWKIHDMEVAGSLAPPSVRIGRKRFHVHRIIDRKLNEDYRQIA